MSFPKHLGEVYRCVLSSRAIAHHDSSPEALAELERLLNVTSPLAHEREQYRAVHGLYRSDWRAFCRILCSGAQELILWTDPRSIVEWFGLHGVLRIRTVKGSFRVTPLGGAPPCVNH